MLARKSGNRCHSRIAIESVRSSESPLGPELKAPCLTEVAYLVHLEDSVGVEVFIVGFALERVNIGANKFKFLNGIGCAIYAAASGFDDETEDHKTYELDKKSFLPRKLSRIDGLVSLAEVPSPVQGKAAGGSSKTWDPVHEFSFPVKAVPILSSTPEDLALTDFSSVKHITDGSNANIFLALYGDQKVPRISCL